VVGAYAELYGDAGTMSGRSRGGNDILTIQSFEGDAFIYGDAKMMSDYARGGNDRLVGGPGNENLWGDAATMTGHAVGGNDAFVFEASSGHDQIHDFQQGKEGLSRISCVGGHDGWKGAPACRNAKTLVFRMRSWTSFWLGRIQRRPWGRPHESPQSNATGSDEPEWPSPDHPARPEGS
jgi:hypothetical protein